MAIREVRKYYYTMLGQYTALKEDLKDFEQALKDGYITEDRLEEVKDELYIVKENWERIAYIMYLLELPNRKSKQQKHRNNNKQLEEYFKSAEADLESVELENKSITAEIKKQLTEITKDKQ